MKRLALLVVLVFVTLPSLAHEEEKREIYLLERKIERLEHRIDRLEIMLGRNPTTQSNEEENLTPEQKKLFECQAKAYDAEEMQACAKYIPDAKPQKESD